MAFAPIICRGNLAINGTDVPEQVVAFHFTGTRDQVVIPATFGTDKSFAGGDAEYEVMIEFLPDTDAASITSILFAALDDAAGTITVAGTFREGAVSATNPEWTATALVTDMGQLGGTVNDLARASVTLPLLARPTVVTA